MNKQDAKEMVMRLMRDCGLAPRCPAMCSIMREVSAVVDEHSNRGIDAEFIIGMRGLDPYTALRIVLRAEVYHPNRYFGGETKARTFIASKSTGLFNEARMRKAIAEMAKEVRQSHDKRARSITMDKQRQEACKTTARGLQKHGIDTAGERLEVKVPTRFGNVTVKVVAPTSITISLPAQRTISNVTELLERLR